MADEATGYPVARGQEVVVVHLDDARPVVGLTDLRSGVLVFLRSGRPILLVDISKVEELSSTTVTALLWAQRRCRAQGGAVVLRGTHRNHRKLLQRTGLSRILPSEEWAEERASVRYPLTRGITP